MRNSHSKNTVRYYILLIVLLAAFFFSNDFGLTDVQKTMIKDRITKESLFPRYVLCTTFASKYSSSVRKTMRQEFKADADRLGFTHYREANGSLSDLYSDWGV